MKRRDRFLTEVCNRRIFIYLIFVIATLFLLIQLPYVFVIDRGTGLYVVSVMNVVGLSIFFGSSGLLLWYCRHRSH